MENIEKKISSNTEAKPAKRVILLADLDSEEEIIGGASQKLFFGENPDSASPFAGLFNTPGKPGGER